MVKDQSLILIWAITLRSKWVYLDLERQPILSFATGSDQTNWNFKIFFLKVKLATYSCICFAVSKFVGPNGRKKRQLPVLRGKLGNLIVVLSHYCHL